MALGTHANPTEYSFALTFQRARDLKIAQPAEIHTKPFPLTVYFDSECPACHREITLMEMLNRRERLHFNDFSISSFRAADHGLNPCDLGKVIHACWPDGTSITDVEVSREMWEALDYDFLHA